MIRILQIVLISMIFGLYGNMILAQDSRSYDAEINRLASKIRQYPGNTKNIEKFSQSFTLANEADKAEIHALLTTGQPDIWDKVYQRYLNLDKRQNIVRALPEKAKQTMAIEFTDYGRPLAEAKHNATAYYYAHGDKLLRSDSREDARLAYFDFLKVAKLDPDFRDLDKEIRRAVLKGATHIEFEMYNRTQKVVSAAMIDQLSVIIWEFKRAKYGQTKPEKIDDSYTFILRVVLDEILIGADQVKELEYQEERDVYRDGQVVDTLKCLVTETRQLKRAKLSGSLEYVDKTSGNVVNKVPIVVESVFMNAYALLQGDADAAGEETRKLLMSKRAPYPSNEQMILDATEEFTKKAREVILAE